MVRVYTYCALDGLRIWMALEVESWDTGTVARLYTQSCCVASFRITSLSCYLVRHDFILSTLLLEWSVVVVLHPFLNSIPFNPFSRHDRIIDFDTPLERSIRLVPAEAILATDHHVFSETPLEQALFLLVLYTA